MEKYPNEMLQERFVSTNMFKAETQEDNRQLFVDREQGNEMLYHDDGFFFWMYLAYTDPYYHSYYFTPSTQSSAPFFGNGDGGGDGGGGDYGDGGDAGDGGDGGGDGGDGGDAGGGG